MIKNKHGFTIVEVLVVTVIIAILTALIILAYSNIQADSRNSQRSSRVKVVAGALEQYYQKNGEYPGCTAMTKPGDQVRTNTLPGLDAIALLTPNSAINTTNSITSCSNMTAGAGTDTYAYVGDGSSTCSTGAACMQYTLQYREEGTGNIVSLQGEHQGQAAISGASALSTTSVTNTQINLKWVAMGGALNYRLQQATNSGFSANLDESTTAGTTAAATGLTPGTTYYFRVKASSAIAESEWSNTASATTSISAPATPTTTAAMSGSTAVGTASAVTCTSGTSQYQLRYRAQSTGTLGGWSGWTAWSTSRTYNVGAAQGYRYDFQSHARCQGPNAASASSADSNIASTFREIATPAAPTYQGPAAFAYMVHYTINYASYCPAGTWMINGTFRSYAWNGKQWTNPFGFSDWWENYSGVNQPVQYYGHYQCQSSYATSPYSPESYNVVTVYPY